MNDESSGLDWDWVKSFLAVYRYGSISAASKIMAVSQPTLSRDIQALEKYTNLQLFERTTQGVQLTEAGQTLVEASENMGSAAELFDRQASGLSERLEGDVRISANEVVGVYLLPPAIKALRDEYPDLHVELVISNQVSSLNKREADIAFRMFRPTQPDLVARRLPDLEMGFFAHKDYIKKFGEPEDLESAKHFNIIGQDEDVESLQLAKKLGVELSRRDFVIRTDHLLTQIALARAGAGIVGTHIGFAKNWPELKRVLPQVPIPSLEFWLVCHGDTQFNSRIRTTMEFMGHWFKKDVYRNVIA